VSTYTLGQADGDVLLIGTGSMGTALAQAVLASGRPLTVWNRTASRAAPLAHVGANVAYDLPSAVREAGVILVCVSNQAVARALLEDQAVSLGLRGKVLVQLTTGTPADARRNASWAASYSITYLDVAIIAYPRDIGTSAALLLYGGDGPAFTGLSPIVNAFGLSRYLGEDAGAPALLDAALIGFFYGSIAGYIHGLALVRAEGSDVRQYAELAAPFLAGFIANAVAETGERALTGNFADPQSSMNTHLGGIDLLVRCASKDAGIHTGVVDAIRNSFLAAIKAGRGADDIAVLVETWTAQDRRSE
jgi:3-hydroxyisobutyrate dehydrogenase-like beta-hydroxyacid dehydrogenase